MKEFLEKDHPVEVFVDQISITKQRPMTDKYYINIYQNIAEAMEKTLVGNREPKTTLDESVAKSNDLLK